MMRDIILSGALGRQYGRRHRFAVNSPAEAVQALKANFRGFEQTIVDGNWHVWIGRENVGADRLIEHGSKPIRIAPVIAGAKTAGLLQTIVGAVLIIVGAVISYYGGAGVPLIEAGASMMLGGIIQMLAPVPKKSNNSGSPSDGFSGPVNVTAQGAGVPICYGQLMVGSAVISAGISVDDISTTATNNTQAPTIDYG